MTEFGSGSGSGSVLDCRGQLCPQPVIELARRIGGVPIGALLGVRVDDPAAPNDIAAWCRLRGQEHVGVEAAPAEAEDGPAGRPSVIVSVRRRR